MGNTSMTRLKQSDIEELARMTHYNEVEVVERHNEFISKCPNGRMKLKQFKEIYAASFNSYAEDYAEHIFRSTDNDHNGYVDFREYLKCISITTRGNLDERLHFVFNVYDMDGNGTIDRNEMKQILSAFYSMKYNYRRWLKDETALARTNIIFDKYDINKDGFLTREEFIMAARQDPYIILTDNAPNSRGSIKYKPVTRVNDSPSPQLSASNSQEMRPRSREELHSPKTETRVPSPQEIRQPAPTMLYQPRSNYIQTPPERRENALRQKPLQDHRNPGQISPRQGHQTMENKFRNYSPNTSQDFSPVMNDQRNYYSEQWENTMTDSLPVLKQTTV